MRRDTHSDGFTLIELMAVAAIVSILMAIAIPNFLNAVLRAKVAQSESELALVGWALELYRLDHQYYPPNEVSGQSSAWDLTRLTHPLPYMTSLPEDPFIAPADQDVKEYVSTERDGHWTFFYLNYLQSQDEPLRLSTFGLRGSTNFLLVGAGPSYGTQVGMPPDDLIPYSASNGITSVGLMYTTTP